MRAVAARRSSAVRPAVWGTTPDRTWGSALLEDRVGVVEAVRPFDRNRIDAQDCHRAFDGPGLVDQRVDAAHDQRLASRVDLWRAVQSDEAGEALMDGNVLGRDVFLRGMPQQPKVVKTTESL